MVGKRSKDFEGLMNTLHAATAVMNQARFLLQRTKDTESVMAVKELHRIHEDLVMAARDLASGMIDLRALPFDQTQHELVFNEVVFEPEQLEQIPFIQEEDDDEVLLTNLVEVAEARDANFDFDMVPGDFGAEICIDDVPTLVLED